MFYNPGPCCHGLLATPFSLVVVEVAVEGSLTSGPYQILREGVGACQIPVPMMVVAVVGPLSQTCSVVVVVGPRGPVAYCWGEGAEPDWVARTERMGAGEVQPLQREIIQVTNAM